MLNPKLIDDISATISSFIPQDLQNLKQDLDQQVRAAVQAALAKFDLVSQEEFRVQTKVLAKTRAKLEALEQRLQQLEDSK